MKDLVRFVYMAYGGWQFRSQAVLSIHSFAALKGAGELEIIVYTDEPSEFEHLPVETVHLTRERIRNWRGPYGFSHRMKIELLMDLFKEGRGHIVYVDSDTFWTKPPEDILRFLDEGRPVMHEREHELSKAFFPDYLKVLKNSDVLAQAGLPVYLPKPLWIYNAGILGLPAGMDPVILEEVLRLCDLLSRSVPFRMEWVEQAAFSFIFQSRGMNIGTCTGDLIHYWRDSFEFGRRIRKFSQEELARLGGDPKRVRELIEDGQRHKRGFWNQVLVRAKRLERSFRKRKRESLVFLESLKLRLTGGRH